MRFHSILNALCRWTYLVAAYCGIRAVFNRIRSAFCVSSCHVARLHGTQSRSGTFGDMSIFVHPRPSPRSLSQDVHFGIISIRLQRPRIGRLLYWYIGLTSHFGCGHMEIAFYERRGNVTFYGVRNIARSNARRIGWSKIAQRLVLAQGDEEVLLIHEIVRLLEQSGCVTTLAAVPDCVKLSVCDRLLHPDSQLRAVRALSKKYQRLQRRLDAYSA